MLFLRSTLVCLLVVIIIVKSYIIDVDTLRKT